MDKAEAMETLLEKEALVVNKQETLDAEDRESIEFELTFVIDCDNADPDIHKGHITLTMSTDDRTVFDKFKVGDKTDLKFMKPLMNKLTEVRKAKAN